VELGSGEIVLILIVALLIYGGRLPDVARALGKSFGELKRGLTETRDTVTRDLDPDIKIEDDDSPRDVLRMGPAPEELAKEDISSPPSPAAEAPAVETPSPPTAVEPAKPDDDPRTRHEHPN
jgi:Sec-independent protein translocase protein TatA